MLSIVKHILLVSVVISQCANPRLRQEWNQLGAAQKTKFLNALNALKARPKGDQGNPAAWNYEQFADSHNAVASDNHGKPQFFVWHREFTNQFENALQSVDPTVTVPYWDWRVDSQRPFQAAVFAPAAFGGDGNSAPTNCVNNGVANGWKFAGDTCLKRCFRRNTVFFSPEAVSSLISSSPNFASLRNNIENGPHAAVHAAVGGDCGHMNTMLSPYDPIFWLHHAMVDKLYDNWMNLCPQFKTDFGTLTPDYRLNPFPRTVGQISDIRANGFCYSYSRSAGDNPAPKITCPGAAPTPTVAITVSGTQTITIDVPGPTPTSQVNDVWLQMWTQTLILGVNRFRVDPTKLDTSAAMAKRISIGASFKAEENTTAIVKPHHKVIKAELIGSITAPNSKYVPLPQYFFNPDFKVAAPLQEDDTDLVNIRPPTFIEKELLEKMHFDHKLFGEVVNFAEMIDDQYNNLPGRTSAAALCNTLDRTIQLPNK